MLWKVTTGHSGATNSYDAQGRVVSKIATMPMLVKLWRSQRHEKKVGSRGFENGIWHEDHVIAVASSHIWSDPDGLTYAEFSRMMTRPPWNSLLSDNAAMHQRNIQHKVKELNSFASGPQVTIYILHCLSAYRALKLISARFMVRHLFICSMCIQSRDVSEECVC